MEIEREEKTTQKGMFKSGAAKSCTQYLLSKSEFLSKDFQKNYEYFSLSINFNYAAKKLNFFGFTIYDTIQEYTSLHKIALWIILN